MQTSAAGLAFLKRHEGEVLRAYRCPAGVWTIGVGLTAGSGVVAPRAGMVITPKESARLLAQALARNYEPRVARAMPQAAQHEFDGGVSFDFNTGAIHRAAWVRQWVARNWPGVRDGLMAWTRGGGRVLPGLERRRKDEYALIHAGDYGTGIRWPARPGLARVVIDLEAGALEAARDALAALGYAPGDDTLGIAEGAVRAFQATHGLTVDGVIGRATLATLQREIDARHRALTPTAATALGTAETATGAGAELAPEILPPEILAQGGADWLGPTLLALGVLGALWLAWRYRDVIAARLHHAAPRIADWLRSF